MRAPTKATTRWVVVLTAIGSLMAALDTLVVSTALSTIRLDLGATVEQLEWTVNAYNLSFAVLLLTAPRSATATAGATSTRSASDCSRPPRPRRRWRPTRARLIAARAAQGAGAALIVPLGLALLSAAFPPERRGACDRHVQRDHRPRGGQRDRSSAARSSRASAGSGSSGSTSRSACSPSRSSSPACARATGPTRVSTCRASSSSRAARSALVWGLVRGNRPAGAAPRSSAALVAGGLLAAAFVAWERRAPAPMVPPGLFRRRAFSAGNAAMFFVFAALFSAVFFYAQLLQVGLGYGPLGAGLRLMPWTATFLTVAPVAGALADRIGERPLLVAGLALQGAGMAWLALIAGPGLAYGQILAPFIVAGIGVSMAIPAAQNAVVGAVATDAIGKAAGVNSMMRELGGVFGIAVAVAVFAAAGSYASPAAFMDGFTPAILVAAGLSVAGAVAGLALPRRRGAALRAPIAGVPALEEAA